MKSFPVGSSPFFFWPLMLDGFQAVLTGREPTSDPKEKVGAATRPSARRARGIAWIGTAASIPILHENPLSSFPEEMIVPASDGVFQ